MSCKRYLVHILIMGISMMLALGCSSNDIPDNPGIDGDIDTSEEVDGDSSDTPEESENTEDGDTIDDIDTVEDVDIVDDADTVEDVDTADNEDTADDIDTVEDVDVVDDADTVDDVDTVEDVDVVDDADTGEDVDVVDDVDTIDDVDTVDDVDIIDDVDTVDDVDIIDDVDIVDDVDTIDDVDLFDEDLDLDIVDDVDMTDDVDIIDNATGLTVYDVQNPDSPLHPEEGAAVELANLVVTADQIALGDTLSSVFVSDMQSGPWHGIMVVFDPAIYSGSIAAGTILSLSGTTQEYFENSQISASSLTATGNMAVPAPIYIDDLNSIANDAAGAEAWEGVLVEVRNVTVTDDALGYDEFKVDNTLVVDDQWYDYGAAIPNGTFFSVLRGVMTYGHNNRKLLPRSNADMQTGTVDGDVDDVDWVDDIDLDIVDDVDDVDDVDIIDNATGLTVYDVQNPDSPLHPGEGAAVELGNLVVTADQIALGDTLSAVFVSDMQSGPWHGIMVVFDPAIYSATISAGTILSLSGTTQEYFENSQISASSLTVGGTMAVPAPIYIDDLNAIASDAAGAEAWEGVLVEVRNVIVTDDALGYDEFKVDNTLVVDDQWYDYGAAIPNGTFFSVLRGVMTYGHNNRKLLPRSSADMQTGTVDGDVDDVDIVDTVDNDPALTVYDLQNPDSLLHPGEGAAVTLHDVLVVSETMELGDNLQGRFITDMQSGAWHGILMTFTPAIAPSGLSVGDIVTVTGTTQEFFECSQLAASSISITGSAQVPAPVYIDDLNTLASDAAGAEAWEGVLVEVTNATVTDDALGYSEFMLNNTLRVDNQLYNYGTPPGINTHYAAVRGFMTYTFDNRKLLPRNEADMELYAVDGDVDTDMEPTQVRVATYNTELFFDTTCDSNACAPEDFEQQFTSLEYSQKVQAVADSLVRLDADIVLIQEVETAGCLNDLAAAMSPRYPVVYLGETGYLGSIDVGILAEGQLLYTVNHRYEPIDLPGGGTTWFTREFLETHFMMDGRRVIAFVAHFKSKYNDDPDRRLAEATAAHAIINDAAASFPDAFIVFGGDLNDVPGSDPINALENDGTLLRVASELPDNEEGTFWYNGVFEAIDHLFISTVAGGSYISGTAQVVVEYSGAHSLGSSDHAALVAEFNLPN